MEDAEVKPMVNQVECHPRLTQKEVQAFCKEQGIQLEAWSPLMQGELLDNEVYKLLQPSMANLLHKSFYAGIYKMGL